MFFKKVKVNLPRKFKVKSFHQLALKIFTFDFWKDENKITLRKIFFAVKRIM